MRTAGWISEARDGDGQIEAGERERGEGDCADKQSKRPEAERAERVHGFVGAEEQDGQQEGSEEGHDADLEVFDFFEAAQSPEGEPENSVEKRTHQQHNTESEQGKARVRPERTGAFGVRFSVFSHAGEAGASLCVFEEDESGFGVVFRAEEICGNRDEWPRFV